ncbi:MAG TPA: hypothetical protein VKR06_40355 [Ktedonosporobacter sp.]|nr:hypothetical protein [Ktedonosporobacter sp.]
MKPRPIGVAGAVHMISEQVGWAMGGNPNSNTPGPLLRTTDGGVHWQQVTPRGVSIQYIYYALPFDEDMAFLFVLSDQSHCYRTVDGGVTWQFIQLPAKMDQGSETFLDHFHGWANVIGANDQQTLFRTNDGGFTWQYVALFPFSGLFDFTFTDMQTAWLNAPLNNVGSPPTDALYVTHDGGHTWKQQPLPALPQRVLKSALNLGKPTFLTQQEGYFLIPILPFDSRDVDSAAYMYMTQDGGKSWQSRTTVLPTHVVVHNEVFYFVDATHILVKGVEPLLLTLINGKWVQTSSSPTNKYPADGDFVSARVGLVLLPANNSDTANTFDVYRTNDGGKTWQKIGILPTSS